MRPIVTELLDGHALYKEVIGRRLPAARESVWISTANLKAMFVETPEGEFASVLELFSVLAGRGVDVRVLHAELPSRPFRNEFDQRGELVRGGLLLKICPRVHFKCVLIDRAWVYLGSANLTGAGLGAKSPERRNFELGFVTEDFDVIDRTAAMFESVWSGQECKTCKLFASCPDPIGEGPKPRGRRRKERSVGIELGKARRLRRG